MTDVSTPQSEPIEVTLEKLKQFLLAPAERRPKLPDIQWPDEVVVAGEEGDPREWISGTTADFVLESGVLGPNRGALLYQRNDELTGLIYRRAWFIRRESNSLHIEPAGAAIPMQRFAGPPGPLWENDLSWFGFSYYHEATHGSELLVRAHQALVQAAEDTPEYDRRRVQVSKDLVYMPYCWIGCRGWLVERKSLRTWSLGSSQCLESQIWAYYQGFADGKQRELDHLVISAVRDRDKLDAVLLRLFNRRWLLKQGAALLAELPARFPAAKLHFVTDELYTAHRYNSFRFHVEPAEEETES